MNRTPNLDAVMSEIGRLGVGTPRYHEAMWFLLSILARRHVQLARSPR